MLTLRPAIWTDGDDLLTWRNDPETLAAFLQSEIVSRAAHEAWLARTLDERSPVRLYLALDGAQAIGTCRLDPEPDGWHCSITVAPDARGRGYATPMINALCQTVAAAVIADVKPTNERSLRAFRRAGFVTRVERLTRE